MLKKSTITLSYDEVVDALKNQRGESLRYWLASKLVDEPLTLELAKEFGIKSSSYYKYRSTPYEYRSAPSVKRITNYELRNTEETSTGTSTASTTLLEQFITTNYNRSPNKIGLPDTVQALYRKFIMFNGYTSIDTNNYLTSKHTIDSILGCRTSDEWFKEFCKYFTNRVKYDLEGKYMTEEELDKLEEELLRLQ